MCKVVCKYVEADIYDHLYEVNGVYGIRAYLTVACGMLDVSPQTE